MYCRPCSINIAHVTKCNHLYLVAGCYQNRRAFILILGGRAGLNCVDSGADISWVFLERSGSSSSLLPPVLEIKSGTRQLEVEGGLHVPVIAHRVLDNGLHGSFSSRRFAAVRDLGFETTRRVPFPDSFPEIDRKLAAGAQFLTYGLEVRGHARVRLNGPSWVQPVRRGLPRTLWTIIRVRAF